MNIIWTYWEDRPGEPTPPHILLCREVLRHQCKKCEVRLVTPTNVHQYLPDLAPRIWRITLHDKDQNPIAVRCAFIRAFLLERYGGLYVAADCIALKDFAEAFHASSGFDFFAMRRTSAKTNHISIGFYGTVANGKVITTYAEALRQILKGKTHFKWGEVGAHLLTPIVDCQLERVFLFREDQIHPVVAEKQQLLAAADQAITDLIPSDALCLMFFHRIFEREVHGFSLAQSSIQDLYQGNSLISKVLRTVYPQKEFERHFGRRRSSEGIESPSAKSTYIAIRRETDTLIERIGYWAPPEIFDEPKTITPNTNLKIAAVVEERLYQGLRTEAEMMLLTPNNWKSVMKYRTPDLLLMESVWTAATGHWHIGQHPLARDYPCLLAIIAESRHRGIPSVFWFTKGMEYHEHYKDFLRHFDFVFCADPRETEKLQQTGVQAQTLLPCASCIAPPPETKSSQPFSKLIPILFDGWADLDRMEEQFPALLSIRDKGLAIIESRYQVFGARKQVLPNYKKHILGCVTSRGRQSLLRQAKCSVSFGTSLSTATTQQWMGLEAVANGVYSLHLGLFTREDPRNGLIQSCENPAEFVARVEECVGKGQQPNVSCTEDTALLARRVPTFAQRLKHIYQSL